MQKENIAVKSIKFVFKETLLDVLHFPIWWYSLGLKKAFYQMTNTITQGNESLGVTIWLKNIFKPMFGQYDWQGRIISFLMRVFQIIFRFILLLFWIIFSVVIFLFWIGLPLFIMFQVLFNFGIFT